MKKLLFGSALLFALSSCGSNSDAEKMRNTGAGTTNSSTISDSAHPTNQSGATGNGGVGTGTSSGTGAGTDENGSGNGTPSGGRP